MIDFSLDSHVGHIAYAQAPIPLETVPSRYKCIGEEELNAVTRLSPSSFGH